MRFCFPYLFSFLSCLFFFTGHVSAQKSVRGSILDSAGVPASYISVGLMKAKDSTLVKGTLCSEKGEFEFEKIPAGKYFIKATAVGFKDLLGPVFWHDSLADTKLGDLHLQPKGVNLQEVSVTVIKKPIEFKNGNITVNIDGNPIAVGNSVYDLLTKLPGVTVIDDVISIQGKSGIRIMIDDRIQQLTGQQLINLLRSINASVVDKIEILKNPPVKYDAAGSGLINIKTKRAKITGFSGSASTSYQQGYYSNKDAGLSLNYKGKDFAVFSNLNSGLAEYRYVSIFERTIDYNGSSTFFDQRTYEKNSSPFVSGEIGTEFYLNKRNTVGLRVDSRNGQFTSDRYGNNYLNNSADGYNQLQFSSHRPNSWNFMNVNLNSEHKFDSLGTSLRTSFDYGKGQDHNTGSYDNRFLDSTLNESLNAKIFRGDNRLDYTFISGRADFEKSLNKKLKMEAGVKGSDQNMLSDYVFEKKDISTGDYKTDSSYTNKFTYRENIAAGYLNFQYNLKKFNFQVGARGENTWVNAESKTSSVGYNRNYFNFFPLISVDYNPNDNHHFQLMYNKRLERPYYSAFNPYKVFMNLYVSNVGNPYLRPAYFDTYELSYNYKGIIFNSTNYTHIENTFYGYPIQNDSTKESTNKQGNLSRADNFTYNVFIQHAVKKWMMLNFNGGINYITFSGTIDGKQYSGATMQTWLSGNLQFNLPKNFRIDVNGFGNYAGRVVIYHQYERWQLNLALKKSFLNNKLNFVLGVNDIFYTMVNRSSVDYLNIHSTLFASNDTRRFRASISYSFGKVKVQQRLRNVSDEKKRMDH